MRTLMHRIWVRLCADDGSATVEYAMVAVGAAAFGLVLWAVVSGQSVNDAITGLINRALSFRQ
ncbi:DUF4244 domain-containing protein [Kutzneria sp. NPDC052558]|uniref:DUF4244 domain-containing protein n=1 Tax=Kutzneria sp. NPDC052558 TaxID=3364121 RepID=UPI0037C938AC